mmetsp:Transcript_15788/g.42454  ORF Transcript_15788/g.42454 Transcript_15788/m.42454 type:complete len:543 (+) Transcript_15788:107-1735(+)
MTSQHTDGDLIAVLFANELDFNKDQSVDVVGTQGWVRSGGCGARGWRNLQEDTLHTSLLTDQDLLCAVFDGHAGSAVARVAAQGIRPALLASKGMQSGDPAEGLAESFATIDSALFAAASGAEVRVARSPPPTGEMSPRGLSSAPATQCGSGVSISATTSPRAASGSGNEVRIEAVCPESTPGPEERRGAHQQAGLDSRTYEEGEERQAASYRFRDTPSLIASTSAGDEDGEEDEDHLSLTATLAALIAGGFVASMAARLRLRASGLHVKSLLLATSCAAVIAALATVMGPITSVGRDLVRALNPSPRHSHHSPVSTPGHGVGDEEEGACRAQQLPPELSDAARGVDATECGAAALAAVVRRNTAGEIAVYVANAGTCRCVLGRQMEDSGGDAAVAVELTTDHRPAMASEKRRVLLADSPFSNVDARGRLNGALACSRALGSLKYKAESHLPAADQVLSGVPDTRVAAGLFPGDVLVLATDGVWDTVTNEQAIALVRAVRSRLGSAAPTSAVCAEFLDTCLRGTRRTGRGSDNMAVVVVELE